ncbi:MAG: ribose-phosphate pyrophosphokinase [Labilithrix sp.]|nr:ribose-phosphate pyrophosphokinase [Labilithrix sp.]
MASSGESAEAPPNIVVLTGSAHPVLGAEVARELGMPLGVCRTARFPDGEIQVEIDDLEVEGEDVAIVQPTPSGAAARGDALLELLFIADACHRGGAASIFAVVPYFGYARQDARKLSGVPLGARVVTRLLGTAPFERVVTVDPHSDVLGACLDAPMVSLSAVPLLVEALDGELAERERDLVVVAPDVGAVRLAREYARRLRAPVAVAYKVRTSGAEVSIERIAGDVRGRRPIIVDDMITTGGTMVAAAGAVQAEGSLSDVTVAATHAVLTPGAMDRLREAGLRRVVVTDTLASSASEYGATVVSVARLLAASIRHVAMRRRRAQLVLHP